MGNEEKKKTLWLINIPSVNDTQRNDIDYS